MTYSFEYIKLVIKQYRYFKIHHLPVSDLFTTFTVSKSRFYDWLRLYGNSPFINEKDSVIHKRQTFYKPNNKKLTDTINTYMVNEIKNNSQIPSHKIRDNVEEIYSVKFTTNHISRILRNNKYTLKKYKKNQ